MCPIPQPRSAATLPRGEEPQKDRSVSCFTSQRVNDSTFVIIEEDKWYEIPYIYVKVYPSLLVLVDTGCGGAAKNPAAGLTSLREYIETVSLRENGDEPLNRGGAKEYVIICTHCHFDHIGGIAQFPDATIWAGSHDKSFLDKAVLDTTSICRFFDMPTPEYAVTHWASDGQEVESRHGDGLGLFVHHTPGHTPDEIAIWDPAERVLFMGDTLYERIPIVFPFEGDIKAYFGTLDKVRALVEGWNAEAGEDAARRVTMACGHATSAGDAVKLLDDVDSFLCRLLLGEIVGRPIGEEFRGEPLIAFREEGNVINMLAAEKVFAEFRKDEEAMGRMRERKHLR
ncbi:beta-lactamase-like protein [Microdochium bolleyi]|uniref:Beta-lactamase-like protein n=1 Tax=Microdochium bolleyi TaxID=196109 RepID=A0A136IYZ4_9PEZI|nr:beta-lactamase-like protein [Microdochium bolleyi]